jgi:hypothetical protein
MWTLIYEYIEPIEPKTRFQSNSDRLDTETSTPTAIAANKCKGKIVPVLNQVPRHEDAPTA